MSYLSNLIELAESGDEDAQYELGKLFCHGDDELGIEKDDQYAYLWISQAAEREHIDAQGHLGFIYAKGIGVEQDDKKAIFWFRKAALQNNVDAQSYLGYLYGKDGSYKDDEQSFFWAEKAAKQGHIISQYHLGSMYFNGDNIQKDYKEAFFLVSKSC